MEINSKTKLFCLIGHPIEHSISPQLHNTAFKYFDLNCVYLTFDVEPTQLSRAIKGLKALRVSGFNVTIPHKVSIIRYLDGLDISAKETGAVNTVVLKNNKLIGYNTDVEGIKKSIENIEEVRDGRALVIGAGGAARAAIVALKMLGFKEIIIANRRLLRAATLVRRFRDEELNMRSVSLFEMKRYSKTCSVIINATPIGMWPHIDETPLNSTEIPKGSLILDLVYNPMKTRLLEEAKKAGATIVYGVNPLIEQAIKSFQLWTNLEPPRELLLKVAEQSLQTWGRNEG
ncbi:MAG: shikimate dehydrogenase [Aigarchaeota archaeon]|nr:shikimate dehydrogenase [Aigarchaeota archaeon]MDW7986265.1 shikimate dehydrogenase [Nitrososphaerota archaeon]